MATDTKNLQTKNLIQRSDIRTMKKDIQQLRRTGFIKETEKIITTPVVEQKTSAELSRTPSLRSKDTRIIREVGSSSSAGSSRSGVPSTRETLATQRDQKAEIPVLKEIDFKQTLPKVEEKKAEIEKNPSAITQDRPKIDMQEMEKDKKIVQQNQTKESKQPIKANFSSIAREDNMPQLQSPDKVENSRQSRSNEGSSIESGQKQQQPTFKETPLVEQSSLRGKEYLKRIPEIPLDIKEKLSESGRIEEKQRKKFMEDIEEWAKEAQ